MRNSKRNGFIKSLTSVIAVVLMLALMLTGCTDKDAQSLANEANSAAQKAQDAANAADKNATDAQGKIEVNEKAIAELKKLVESLPNDEDVAKTITDALAKYVKGGAVVEGTILTEADLAAFLESKAFMDVLAQYVTIASLSETLVGYYTKAEVNTIKSDLEEDIAELDAWVADAAKTIVASDEFKTAVEAALADYATKEDLNNSWIDFNEGYKEATDYILDNDVKFEELLAEYAAKEGIYDKAVYAALVYNINLNRVAFRRALTKGDAETILAKVTSESAQQINLAETLANALDDVYRVRGYIVIEDRTGVDNTGITSRTGLAKAEAILATINAQMTEEEIAKYAKAYDDGARDLVAEVTEIRATVDKLDDVIQPYADTYVTPLFLGIQNYTVDNGYASVMVDEAEKFFGDGVLRDRDILEQEADAAWSALNMFIFNMFDRDIRNPNIERLIPAEAWTQYYAAVGNGMDVYGRINELNDIEAEAAEWSDAIAEELAKYVIEGTDLYLYTDYEALNAYKTGDLKTWIDANFAAKDDDAVIAAVIEAYADLVDAVDYANYVKTEYAETAADLITAIDALLAYNNVYSAESYAKKVEVVQAYTAWFFNNGTFGVWVDTTNHDLILGADRLEAYKEACDVLETINTYLADLNAINAKIDELKEITDAGKLNIKAMGEEIRPLRNAIVSWLNNANVAVPESDDVLVSWILHANEERNDVKYAATAEYNEGNWALLKSADLISVIEAYNAIVKEALDAAVAEDGPVTLIDLINVTDGYILYQKDAIDAANSSLALWISEYQVGTVALETFDLGEGNDTDLIYSHVKTLINANALYKETLDAAKNDYAGIVTLINSALITDPSLLASDIPEAMKAVNAWADKYMKKTDGAYDFIELEGLLTANNYTVLVGKYNAYEALVAEALADYNEFKAAVTGIKLPYTVYTHSEMREVYQVYAAKVVATMDKYGITDLDADFVSADMDERFKSNDLGIEMAMYLNLYNKIFGDGVDSYNAFIDGLVLDLTAIGTDLDAVKAAGLTIYSEEAVKAVYNTYLAWALEAGMINNVNVTYDDLLAAYNGADINIAMLQAILEDIIATKDLVEGYVAEKTAATENVEKTIADLIEVIQNNKGVTTAQKDLILAAEKLYNEWLNGDANNDGTVTAEEAAIYAIDPANDLYNIDNKTSLDSYLDILAQIEDLADVVEEKADALDDGATQEEIDALNKAIDDLKDANGGAFYGSVSAEDMIAREKAEMALAYAKALAEAEALKATIGNDAYEALVKAIDDTYATYTTEILNDKAVADAFANGADNAYDEYSGSCESAFNKELTKAAANV